MTDADYASNRAALSATLRNQLNLTGPSADWSSDQRIAYNKAYAAAVLANPQNFSPQESATAQAVASAPPSVEQQTGILSDISTFGSSLADNVLAAGQQVAGIGNGVLNLASAMKYIIPLAGVTVLVILAMGFYKTQVTRK